MLFWWCFICWSDKLETLKLFTTVYLCSLKKAKCLCWAQHSSTYSSNCPLAPVGAFTKSCETNTTECQSAFQKKKKKRGPTAHVVIPPGKFKIQYTCLESGKVSECVTNSCTALGPPTIYEQHRERWSSTAEQLMERGQKEMWDLNITQ